jgi:hypothetical protein
MAVGLCSRNRGYSLPLRRSRRFHCATSRLPDRRLHGRVPGLAQRVGIGQASIADVEDRFPKCRLLHSNVESVSDWPPPRRSSKSSPSRRQSPRSDEQTIRVRSAPEAVSSAQVTADVHSSAGCRSEDGLQDARDNQQADDEDNGDPPSDDLEQLPSPWPYERGRRGRRPCRPRTSARLSACCPSPRALCP